LRRRTNSATPPSSGGRPNAERHFRGEKRTNDTHGSTSDGRWFHKGAGKDAKLCHMGHLPIEPLRVHRQCPHDRTKARHMIGSVSFDRQGDRRSGHALASWGLC
jgi:hypothetical protein